MTATIQALIDAHSNQAGALLPTLHALQAQFGYIPAEATPLIAHSLNLSRAEVQGVLSFYHHFRTTPPGKYVLQICRAESCQAMGGRDLETHAKAALGLNYHQTTADGCISLEPVYCLGNCACSPAVRVGDEIQGRMDVAQLDALIAELRQGAAA
ncbi:formate dehydrogenase subunit gamma [Thiothrix eikelboomii]|uniref:NADH-quinone oxidoreductase subunit E n=1 Tax=Thiothrix eikelboomii TaxID=92487 RepID=A0A1T4W442_9GAMM|nr:formate dehydrogenase subunit gamma [Thiothrix eikelboomii]SKA71909.1 formate dehydrogenase subunit gamma [Thiothrix eikelboomii]